MTGYLFVNTGITDDNARDWEQNRRYRFIGAGGGPRWINAIKKLRKGDRIFALTKGKGYIGYGMVQEEAVNVKNYEIDGRRIVDELPGDHPWKQEKDPLNDEWLVKVDWLKTFDESEARWFKGAFANQNVVCKLRDRATFEFLAREFELETDK